MQTPPEIPKKVQGCLQKLESVGSVERNNFLKPHNPQFIKKLSVDWEYVKCKHYYESPVGRSFRNFILKHGLMVYQNNEKRIYPLFFNLSTLFRIELIFIETFVILIICKTCLGHIDNFVSMSLNLKRDITLNYKQIKCLPFWTATSLINEKIPNTLDIWTFIQVSQLVPTSTLIIIKSLNGNIMSL